MAYETTLLKTVAECEDLLKMVATDKANLNYKVIGLQNKQTAVAGGAPDVDVDLVKVNARIKSYEAMLASPTATEEDKASIRESLMEARKDRKTLLKKDLEYTSGSILRKVCAINRVQKEIEVIDLFMAEVTAYKDTL